MVVTRATTWLLVGALISGGAAAYFTSRYIKNSVQDYQDKIDLRYRPVKIVVPKHDLRTGDLLRYDDLAVRPIPRDFVSSSAVRPAQVNGVVGRRLVNAVGSGEPILLSHVEKDKAAGFDHFVVPGQRALTFPVDVVSSMSGLLSPGNHIDLLATLRDGNRTRTILLLNNVRVLATGSAVDTYRGLSNSGRYQTITLMVSPKNAARITQARKAGTLTVTLRAPKDDQLPAVQSVTIASLLGYGKSRWRGQKVEIIRGGVR